MGLPLFENAPGDLRNATALAVASDLSYYPEAEGAVKFKSELDLDAKLLSVGNTQAYVGGNDDRIVVAFRGTEAPTSIDGLKDWLLSDAMNLLIIPEGRMGTDFAAAGVGAKFHQGFIGALTDLWGPLFEAVDAEMQKKERPLWLTGHSLGGALAVLGGWLFHRKFVPVQQIVTFGGPMIGNAAAVAAIDKKFAGKIFRYVNFPDPVPKLPTVSLVGNDFIHCEKEMGLGDTSSAGGLFDLFKGLAGKSVGSLITGSIASEIWEYIKSRVDAHAMTSYRGLLK